MLAFPLFIALAFGGSSPADEEPETWSFPDVKLEIGERLPNFRLPSVEGGEPVALYDLLAGKPTLLHVYASW